MQARLLLLESYIGAGEIEEVTGLLERSSLILTQEEMEQLREQAVSLLLEEARQAETLDDAVLASQIYETILAVASEDDAAAQEAKEQLSSLQLQLAVENSLDSFAAVLAQDPDNVTALEMMAALSEADGDYEAAVEYYERLAACGEEDLAQEGLARIWAVIAQSAAGEEAVSAWEKVLTYDPSSEEAYLALAALYLEADDTGSALVILEQGLEATGSETIAAQCEELSVSEFEQLVIDIIESITTEDMTAQEKLRACYDYIIETTSYVRTYESPSGDWTKDYALDVLARQEGNCYRYSAAFAYMSKELGFDAKVCTGQVSAARGGTTPHGWVVLTIDGVEYLCDPDLEQSLGYDFYLKTFDEYPVKPLITEEEWEIEF